MALYKFCIIIIIIITNCYITGKLLLQVVGWNREQWLLGGLLHVNSRSIAAGASSRPECGKFETADKTWTT